MQYAKASDLRHARFERVGHGKKIEKATHLDDLPDDVTHANQYHLALYRPQLFAGQQYDAQTGRTDEIQIAKVEDKTFGAVFQMFRQHPLNLRGTDAIQASDRSQNQNIADGFVFKSHGCVCYQMADKSGYCTGRLGQ
ncbi:MAG: hypothetical protein H6R18_403 [Proteobacteria bacterium]|nr:hypothetical protein [Pseudomonadota bacterium]